MAQYSFTMSTIDVTITSMPVFDGGGRQLYSVSGSDLDAVIGAINGQVIEFQATANQVNAKLCAACKDLIDALSPHPSVVMFFYNHSRPSGESQVWSGVGGSPDLPIHPSQNGTNVCVSVTSAGGTTYWRQVAFLAAGGQA